MKNRLIDWIWTIGCLTLGMLIGWGASRPAPPVIERVEVMVPVSEAHYLYKEFILHPVVQGESLSKLAGMYYGDEEMYTLIAQENPGAFSDVNLIYPYQVLRIPVWADWQERE